MTRLLTAPTAETMAASAAAKALAADPKALLQSFIDAGKLDLQPDQRARVLVRLKDMPQSKRRTYLCGQAGNRKAAIRAFCYECFGWGDHPELCTSPECPLFNLRPRSAKQGR